MPQSLLSKVLKLALPVAVQNVMVNLLSMSDVFMVAGLGAASVAAIGLSAKLHFVLIMIMVSLGTAVSVLVSQYYGRNDNEKSQGVLALGMLAGLVLLIPVGIAFFAFPRQLLSLLSNDAVMIDLGTTYLRMTVALLFLTHIIICYESALRARGETVVPLVLASIAIVMNIALNYVLIHGIGPFPELGVAGVAVASVIARFTQTILLIAYLSYKRHAFAITNLIRECRRAKNLYGKFFHIAWPLAVNFTAWGIGTFMYNAIASLIGTEALAALSLISPIEGLYHSLFFGLAIACSVMIGQSLGRDDFDMAKWLAKRFTIFAPIGSFFVGMAVLALKPLFLPLLLDPSDSLYALCSQLIWVMCLMFWVKVINLTLMAGILRAGGDSKWVLGGDMVSMWALGLPATAIAAFVFHLSYPWIYGFILVEEGFKAIFMIYRYRRGLWLKNLTDDDDHKPSKPESFDATPVSA